MAISPDVPHEALIRESLRTHCICGLPIDHRIHTSLRDKLQLAERTQNIDVTGVCKAVINERQNFGRHIEINGVDVDDWLAHAAAYGLYVHLTLHVEREEGCALRPYETPPGVLSQRERAIQDLAGTLRSYRDDANNAMLDISRVLRRNGLPDV